MAARLGRIAPQGGFPRRREAAPAHRGPPIIATHRSAPRLRVRSNLAPPVGAGCLIGLRLPTPEQRAWLLPELQRALLTGAIEPATCSAFVTKAFLVPKPGQPGKWRLVIDLRHVNWFLLEQSCRYETLASARDMFRRGDFMFSLDLQDGYHCVAIHPADRKYLTFEVAGVGRFQCSALPMGLGPSALVFTKTMRAFVAALRSPMQVLQSYEARQHAAAHKAGGYVPPHRRRAAAPTLRSLLPLHATVMRSGVRTLPYMDDFACAMASLAASLSARAFVEALLDLLGLARNVKKGTWEPTQRLKHLGLGVDTIVMSFFLPEERQLKLEAASSGMLAQANSCSSLVPRRRLAGFVGLAASCILAVPLARHHLRALHDAIGSGPRWDGKVRLDALARESLAWFARLRPQHTFRPLLMAAATAEVWTDASLRGWGAVVMVDGSRLTARGRWTSEEAAVAYASGDINLLEMRAKALTVEACARRLAGRHVHFWGDNKAVTCVATSGSSRSRALMHETRALFTLLDAYNIRNTESWLSTLLNHEADLLSREADDGGLLLSPALSRRLLAATPHTVDRFATEWNALLPRWNSRHLHPRSAGADAFAQTDWGAGRSWCHPPVALLPRLASLLRENGASATVVAPDWPAAAWYLELRSLARRMQRVPAARAPYASPAAAAWGCVVFTIH